MFTPVLTVWLVVVGLAALLGVTLVAALLVDFVLRNRSLRLARHESVRGYYGHFSFTH